MKINKLIQLSKNVTINSNMRPKLGAIIFRKNRILGIGYNFRKTHPHPIKNMGMYWTIHAELMAILNSKEDLNNSEIFVFREFKNGALANAKPCHMCMELIKYVGIKKIIYTTNNFPFYETLKIKE